MQSFYIPRSNPDGVAITVGCIDEGTVKSVEVRTFDGRKWESEHARSGIAEMSKL